MLDAGAFLGHTLPTHREEACSSTPIGIPQVAGSWTHIRYSLFIRLIGGRYANSEEACRVHVDRVVGGDCYHCHFDCAARARRAESSRGGGAGTMSEQSQAN